MAKQTINQGTAPTGAGGDTFRTGSAKLQANDNELYAALGANASGALPTALPITNGGTGATSANEALKNLGLNYSTDFSDVAAAKKLGAMASYNPSNIAPNYMDYSDFLSKITNLGVSCSGSVYINSTSADGTTPPINQWNTFLSLRHRGGHGDGNGYGTIIVDKALLSLKPNLYVQKQNSTAGWGIPYYFYTEANTTVDSNGFIKKASPIVELYADHAEPNEEAKEQTITFEKIGTGDYLLKGSSGFAQTGWYIEQPKDANGNVYHAVVHEQLENGDISIKTYEQKLDGVRIVADLEKPVDVVENRFISIRLQELPQQPVEAPQPDPTITDYQGNPAPSHLHELVNGTWIISSENAEILENERLAAMPALTRRQFRLALVLNGYNLADIETLINSIEDPMQRQITMIEWQDATTFERLNPSLLAMADLMGLGAEQVNMLWNQALTL